MADRIDSAERSEIMRRIGSSATQPELVVRALVKRAGYGGYRFNLSSVLGSPDICWKGRKIAIFVHGCFWHGHDCRHGRRAPSSNTKYWKIKLARNIERDKQSQRALLQQGWHILVIWECQLSQEQKVWQKIKRFMTRYYG
jgi:DNA mismatch endonuclease (patch repair protein)